MAHARDSLRHYRDKRDFTRTPEPEGRISPSLHHRYLIQKHAASHLHYDFRLELDGTLKSWAVPKGPSLDPQVKRLAIQVEDHPIDYGSFEGIIPKGQYGGGTVMLWDEGSWEPVGDARKGLEAGKLVFRLHGERLRGEWTLVKTFSKDKRGNNWLLIKHADEETRTDSDAFMEENNTSVASGRTMEAIAAPGAKIWTGKDEGKAGKPAPRLKMKPAAGVKLPAFVPPQLATLSDKVPQGPQWVHEIKFDGYRMIACVAGGTARIYSRNGKDWTDAFAHLAQSIAALLVTSAVLDGEVIAIGDGGRSDFSLLKDALSRGEYEHLQYYLFDLLYLNGKDLASLPLLERKEKLAALMEALPARERKRLFFSEHFTEAQPDLMQKICGMRLEGIVSKNATAPYRPGRSKLWYKTKCQKRQEFVLGGFTLPSTGAPGVGALLLGYYDDGEIEYAGRVGTGFTHAASLELRQKLDKLRRKASPFAAISTEGRRGAVWVEPKLVAEVEFTEWTPDGHLRHPSFKGLREDKPAEEIVREFAVTPKATASAKASAIVAGIAISHPERIIYPQSHITKQQLAEYYFAVADHILPHIANRPLSMVRCPEGAGEPCFFQRHAGLGKSPHLHEVAVTVKGTRRDYLMIRDLAGLISLVQWGVIELHPWQCTARQLDKPDRIVFDLDPGPSVSWKQLIAGAAEIRQRMQEMGLEAFLKTTGGKGLHVVVPLVPAYGFATIKQFARAVAESMASDTPGAYTATLSKAARGGKIFVDYLRNDVTATAVAAYSARARTGATVSTPLAWRELTPALDLARLTLERVQARLQKLKKDPWQEYEEGRRKIPRDYLKALKITPD